MKYDEVETGLDYADILALNPEYFTEANLQQINSTLEKWSYMLSQYESIEEAFKDNAFSDEEVASYALLRSAIYFSENFSFEHELGPLLFEKIYSRFKSHYLGIKERG